MSDKYLLDQLERDLKHLCERPMGRRLLLASVPTLLAGCASVSSDRHREGSNKGQNTKITIQDEKKMAQDYLPQMKKDYPPYNDRFLQNYLNYVGEKIVRANKLENKPYKYTFTLARAKMVNAFALPAGTVFVTGPLLAMADSEAELAGVIGHEIGHIKARHTAERIDKAQKEQSKALLYGLGGAILGGLSGMALGQAICKKEDKECLERVTKYGAALGGAGGLLIQKYAFMANSREDEMEADRIGFRTSVAAGYHKDHVGRFYSKLLAMEEKHKNGQNKLIAQFADAMSTHPPSKERVTQMNQMARNQKLIKSSTISSADFEKAKRLIMKLG